MRIMEYCHTNLFFFTAWAVRSSSNYVLIIWNSMYTHVTKLPHILPKINTIIGSTIYSLIWAVNSIIVSMQY